MTEKVDVLGLQFNYVTKKELVESLSNRIADNEKTFVVTANPEIVMHAKENPNYKKTVEQATYIIADGIGVIYGARLLNQSLPERIPGYELMVELLQIGNKEKLKVYFLGATQEVIDALQVNVEKQFPNLIIAGTRNGYFEQDDTTVYEDIKNSNPDLVFVALGFPRQEEWIHQHIDSFEKGLFMGVGGSFDVLANKVKRAPLIWQKLNLEWLYRLLKQPSRWKRMLVLPQFLLEVLKVRRK